MGPKKASTARGAESEEFSTQTQRWADMEDSGDEEFCVAEHRKAPSRLDRHGEADMLRSCGKPRADYSDSDGEKLSVVEPISGRSPADTLRPECETPEPRLMQYGGPRQWTSKTNHKGLDSKLARSSNKQVLFVEGRSGADLNDDTTTDGSHSPRSDLASIDLGCCMPPSLQIKTPRSAKDPGKPRALQCAEIAADYRQTLPWVDLVDSEDDMPCTAEPSEPTCPAQGTIKRSWADVLRSPAKAKGKGNEANQDVVRASANPNVTIKGKGDLKKSTGDSKGGSESSIKYHSAEANRYKRAHESVGNDGAKDHLRGKGGNERTERGKQANHIASNASTDLSAKGTSKHKNIEANKYKDWFASVDDDEQLRGKGSKGTGRRKEANTYMTDLCTNRRSMRVGKGNEVDKFLCQFIIGLEEDKEFGVVKRLLGRGGANIKKIWRESGAKLRIRGLGSGFLEGEGAKKMESNDPLMLCISAEDNLAFETAIRAVSELIEGIYKDHHAFCRQVGEPPRDLSINIHWGYREGSR